MANGKALIPKLNEAQLRIINGKTPKQYIKQREGRGGKMLDYVEVGYVVQQLNQAFNFAWDFEIQDQQVGAAQIWVKGILRLHLSPTFAIVKSAFGGADIKKWDKMYSPAAKQWVDHPKKGQPIDIGDDLKAAAADALKKAASLIGIAGDVYYKQLDLVVEDNGNKTIEPEKEAAGEVKVANY